MITYNNYIKYLKNKVGERVIKVEFLDKHQQVTGDDTFNVLSGNLNIKLHAHARRSCSLTFQNKDGIYIPNEDSNVWINKQFKLYTGLKVNNEYYYNLRGTFIVGNPVLNSVFSDITASVDGIDKWARLDGTLGGVIESTYVINVNTPITDVVKMIFQEVGETSEPIIFPTAEVTPYTITKEPGATFADILTELANLLSWEVFYDVNGHPRFQPSIDTTKEGEVWHFSTNETSYLGSAHTYSFDKIRNIVKVIGDNINGNLVTGIAEDTNIFSPFSIAKIGRKPQIINDDLIYSENLANQRADYELKKLISLQESVNMKSLPIDIINEGEVITVEDKNNDLHRDRYQVQSISENLRFDGEMTLEVWRERNLS